DVFPSGHTQLTLVCTYLAFHYRLRSRWLIAVLATLLIIGTVYLRYHYVVDLLGGVLFFVLTIWTGNKIEPWWKKVSHSGTVQGAITER
ncbi:MAG TPA: phosphatase PAP2 family protein, partial [Terriglobia bacterium]|nr:phosphatase PAP2 family protein [Terriglobia bacterium]